MKKSLKYSKAHVFYVLFNIILIILLTSLLYIYNNIYSNIIMVLVLLAILFSSNFIMEKYLYKKYKFKIKDKKPYNFLIIIPNVLLVFYLTYNKTWLLILYAVIIIAIFLYISYKSILEYNK